MIILIHPPVAKPSEPPAGIARLSGLLHDHDIDHELLDANVEGLLSLLSMPLPQGMVDDTWTRRALRNRDTNVALMKAPRLYSLFDRYKRVVKDLSRVLARVSGPGGVVGLANYEDACLSPVKSMDLLAAAERPELNPFYPYFHLRLDALFNRKKPSVVGFSLNYLSQALTAFSMIGFIRRAYPGMKVILGGGLVTSWSRRPGWTNPFSGLVDHLVAGPGEDQLLAFVGKGRKDRRFPRPDYGALPGASYLSPGFVLPYAASSGCYWNRCSFCPEQAEGNSYRAVQVPQVLSDLDYLSERSGAVLIHLLDNAISPALLEALSARRPGVSPCVPWYGFARIGACLADPDFCTALRAGGCVMLKLGVESGDQDVLDMLQKGVDVGMASMVLRNLKRAGIATYVYLLFGTPAETVSSARRTLEFTVRHKDCIDFLNLAIFNMPLCGGAASGLETREFSAGDLSLYTDFSHPAGWDRKRVRAFLTREFTSHPAVSGILRNDPPVFTSNHAPFFVADRSVSGFSPHRRPGSSPEEDLPGR